MFRALKPGQSAKLARNDPCWCGSGKKLKSCHELQASHLAGVSPAGAWGGDPHGRRWCGHRWTAWLPLSEYRDATGYVRELGLGRVGDWEPHQRLELETDLTGAHVLQVGRFPVGHFIG